MDANTPEGTGNSINDIAASLLTPTGDNQDEGERAEQSAPEVEQAEPETPESQSDDGQSESNEAPQEAQPRKVPVKIDGKDVEVDEAELIKGYQRHADYTRKTQEVADQRKAFEARQAEINAAREQEVAHLNQTLGWIQSKLPQEPKYDQADPIGYVEAKARYDAELAEFRQAVVAVQTRQAELAKQQEQSLKAQIQAESAKLIEAIPEWKDEAKAKDDRKAVSDYLIGAGYSTDDLSNLSDHRAVVIARKAMLYDKLQSQKAEVTKRVVDVPKVMKPGTQGQKTVSDETRALQRLAKTGRVEDLAAALIIRK